jgi:hypothetical protein
MEMVVDWLDVCWTTLCGCKWSLWSYVYQLSLTREGRSSLGSM